MRNKILPLLLWATALMIIMFARPAPAQGIEYLGSTLWTGVNDVKIAGNYAYCAFFNGLVILDITEPASPAFVSQYYIGGDWFEYRRREGQKLAVSGNYVYFAADYLGLQIINISDPTNPTLTAAYSTPSYATDVYISGNYAYVTCASSSLEIIDILDPSNPTLIGHTNITSNARGVYVSGDYAYVADDLGGLQIVNVADPANPAVVSEYRAGSYALDVMVLGNYAYLAHGYNGLQIIDVVDPYTPTYVASWSDPLNVWADGIFISGHYAYLATNPSFIIIDVTDPANPIRMGSLTGDWYLDLHITGDYAYVAALQSGLRVFDVTNPASPTTAGAYDTPIDIRDISVAGNYAYATGIGPCLMIVDITNSANPVVVGQAAGYGYSICASGSYAYVGVRGLRIFDVSVPQSPVLMGSYNMSEAAFDIFVREPYAYVADYTAGLYIINISDPTHPSLTGHYDTPGQAYGVYVLGDYAYVADTYSLQILNVGDPTNPTFSGSYSNSHASPQAVFVRGTFAYLAAGNGNGTGLLVVNVSEPANPTQTGLYQTRGTAWDVAVWGDYAYVAETWATPSGQRLEIIDISDPANPALADSLRTPGDAYGIAVANGNIYLADWYSMMILHSDLTGVEEETPVPNTFSLSQNYPNPFNGETKISYSLTAMADVSLKIFNLTGQIIWKNDLASQEVGWHALIVDLGDNPSGVYFLRIATAGGEAKMIKMVMLK